MADKAATPKLFRANYFEIEKEERKKNRMKKFFAILLSAMLMLSLAVPAMAEGEATYTIEVPSDDNHTYAVYQIFTGDYAEVDDVSILSNIVWGVNGNGYVPDEKTEVSEDVLNVIKGAAGTDAQKAAIIKTYVNFDTTAYKEVSGGEKIDVAPGYYLLKDKDTVASDDAYTTYIIQVVDNVEIIRKDAKPTVDKSVQNDSDDWTETADHEINESFKFKLTATLDADNDYADYDVYEVVFNDTMSAGITFESIDSVTVDGVPLVESAYTCDAKANQVGGTWSLTIADITAIAGVNLTDGAVIEVIYNAHLNEDAVIGNNDDNQNSVNLEYTNNPNADGEGDKGKTGDDTVYVFTYEINSTKYKDAVSEDNKLDGAGFTLYYSTDGITKGDAVKLVYDENDNVYRPAADDATEGYVTQMTSANGGLFNVAGLDQGIYIMEETAVPAGYNKCADIVIKIEATHAENADTSSATATITMTIDGKVATQNDVVNKAGSTLPETGGMGTTIFYTVGGIMVVAAVVLLVTKKRMSAEG